VARAHTAVVVLVLVVVIVLVVFVFVVAAAAAAAAKPGSSWLTATQPRLVRNGGVRNNKGHVTTQNGDPEKVPTLQGVGWGRNISRVEITRGHPRGLSTWC
jgi:hypothetical protein